MGCVESRMNRVKVHNVASAAPNKPPSSNEPLRFNSGKSLISSISQSVSSASSGHQIYPEENNELALNSKNISVFRSEDDPVIPEWDLGESLDTRRIQQLKGLSAQSTDSTDSGIYELDEEYSFVITERSAPDLIARVNEEFTPVENLELIVTGKSCPRLVSGVQKSRMEEQKILQALRDEGFISQNTNKSTGGVSFEIVDARAQLSSASSSALPPVQLRRLEERRRAHQKTLTSHEEIEERLEKAEERRKLAEEERLRRAAELQEKTAGKIENQRQQLQQRQTEKFEAAIEKREKHLKELRDKLKERHQKAANVRLKRTFSLRLNAPIPNAITGNSPVTEPDDFFA